MGVDSQLLVVYVNLAMYAFCFQMQQPVLPATVKELVVGDDSTQAWAQLQSWFGIMQLGGGLVSGVLSDRFGSKNLLLYRSATLGYFDLSTDVGNQNFGGMRPGCWINALPVGGLVLIPDASAGCSCSYQNRSWIALEGSGRESVE